MALIPKKCRVLAALARVGGAVVSHDALLREVWGTGYENEENERAYLAIYVRYLWQQIEDDPGNPTYIHTHRGAGYAFAGWPRAYD